MNGRSPGSNVSRSADNYSQDTEMRRGTGELSLISDHTNPPNTNLFLLHLPPQFNVLYKPPQCLTYNFKDNLHVYAFPSVLQLMVIYEMSSFTVVLYLYDYGL